MNSSEKRSGQTRRFIQETVEQSGRFKVRGETVAGILKFVEDLTDAVLVVIWQDTSLATLEAEM
jgi:hypothetical protein